MTGQTADFIRARIDAMIDTRHPLAVIGSRLPWAQIETALAPLCQKAAREHEVPDRVETCLAQAAARSLQPV